MSFYEKHMLITGGAGFIGSEFVHQFASQGANIVAVDNLFNGQPENLRGVPRDRIQLVVADIVEILCASD